MKRIPCLDLQGQHQKIKSEIFEAFEKVYAKTAFSGGPFVQEFEDLFATYIGAEYAIGVSNGTTALQLAMLTLNIGPGDEVIMPANTFIATAWGASHVGATPVFVDCDADTWEIDASKIEEAITSKTKAVIGVHLYGQPFDIDAVKAICDKHNIFLVEDAAQAQGAWYKGKTVGTFGDIACYSFYPGKNLGACGEAGGITTNNQAYKTHLHSLRNHGCSVRYYHDEIGYNFRMGGLEGASLSVKLKYLDEWNNRRREVATKYQQGINNPKIKMQLKPEWADGVYHIFVVTTENKDKFVKHLDVNGIDAAFHYPVPCHLQKAYSNLDYKEGDFPNSEYLASHCVSLPMFAELTDEDVLKVIEVVNSYNG
ncbi:MAG: DegT/DnrJ/EryC1/StrS family aminotransferase [Candidatus Pedobacter colombiensis]|uniref:DegT/DnrJ/EryC1/StrS family aminotransferase n=1 Tax=Candidatus Pedobacter colombiensis TaxID=3121371 RepID=A0AAJ6B797_9SPHI|nr:DegT/DnrJ/EryC1/StrS family aminotransferase [Pedobacter sp.]WEK19669.1 MAG: DegT/DnrJ/EryC1/StrS family aminotransferase [Pedobacter sp.]